MKSIALPVEECATLIIPHRSEASAAPDGPKLWNEAPSTLARDYVPDSFQPWRAEDGLRIVPRSWEAEGFREVIEFEPDFGLVIGDIQHRENARQTSRLRNTLNFHFRLSGSGAIAVGDGDPFPLYRQTMTLLLSPDGLERAEDFVSGEHEQSVTVFCQPDFLARRFRNAGGKMPQMLRSFIDDPARKPVIVSSTLSAQMALAVRALLLSEFSRTMRRVYAEAKALELLVLALAGLSEMEAREARGEAYIGDRDLDRITRVRRRLEEEFLSPPSITELARFAGINEAKLMHLFKQQVGETIFNFTQRLKMERAKEMLETTDVSVTEIAFDVGYEYSSNFTTAFRRHFGITPKAARDAMRHARGRSQSG